MARSPHFLARRAALLLGYWRSERRTLRQGLAALALSTLAGFVAGLTLGSIHETLDALPGLLILIPPAVAMRGTIFGAIGARLGTATHVGTFEVTLRGGSVLGRNVEVGIISSLMSSFYVAGVAKLIASAFGEPTIPFWDLVTISVVGGTLGSAMILGVTIGLAILSFRKEWDLDAVATPMVTAMGDMATLPALFAATILVRSGIGDIVVGVVSTVVAVGALAWALIRSEKPVQRILTEMIPMITLAPLLSIVAGALLEARRIPLQAVPGLLILIPPFVSQAGALGGILSSRLTSKLQVGVITPRGRPELPAIVDASIIVAFGLAVFTVIGLVATGLGELVGLPHPGLLTTVLGTLAAGVLVMPIILGVAYYLAVLTSRFGLDPDNFGVPTMTGLMDLTGVAAVLFVMTVSGVLAHG
jgi:mgtE-like transporter